METSLYKIYDKEIYDLVLNVEWKFGRCRVCIEKGLFYDCLKKRLMCWMLVNWGIRK